MTNLFLDVFLKENVRLSVKIHYSNNYGNDYGGEMYEGKIINTTDDFVFIETEKKIIMLPIQEIYCIEMVKHE